MVKGSQVTDVKDDGLSVIRKVGQRIAIQSEVRERVTI